MKIIKCFDSHSIYIVENYIKLCYFTCLRIMKLIYSIFLILHLLSFNSSAFIIPSVNNKLLQVHNIPRHNILTLHSAHKNINHNKTNASKVFKMDFSEESEEEQLFKPKYNFGLSEFDMILLRIYIYMVITIYCITIIFENMKK